MSAEDDRDYVDAPAESVTIECAACQGDGWLFVPRLAVVGGQAQSVMMREPCKVCRVDESGVPTGKVNLGTGPGARLKPWQRKPVPGVDDWGLRRT